MKTAYENKGSQEPTTHVAIWKTTRDRLRIIAAMRRQTMKETVHELVKQALPKGNLPDD